MSFFDIFRHPPKLKEFDTTASQNININILEEFVDINGTKISLPCRKDELRGIFGEWMFSMDNLTGTSLRYIYIWHELGIVAYSYDDENVDCISLQFYPGEKRNSINSPKNIFGGSVMVDGNNWMLMFEDEKCPKFDGIKLPIKLVDYGNFSLMMTTDIKRGKRIQGLGINKKTRLNLEEI